MYILLIVIIAALLLCLLGMVGLLNMKRSDEHEKDISMLDFIQTSNKAFIDFVQQSRADSHALQIGHNEIVENYEQEFLSLKEANEAAQQEIFALREAVEDYHLLYRKSHRQRDILRLAVEDHREECLPAVGKPEYYEDLVDVMRELEAEDQEEATAKV